MAQTHIAAAESTGNINASARVRDVANRIAYVDPSETPFMVISSRANSQSASNTKFEWIEKPNAERWDAINNGGGYSSTATELVVDNGAYFQDGDVVAIPRSGEKVRVSSVSSNTLTVTRAFDGDGTTGSTLANNDDLLIIGRAIAENADVGTPHSHQESYPFNHTQIFRTQFGASETLQNSELYTGNDRTRQRREGAKEHKLAIERSALFGERNEFTSGPGSANTPLRTTGGLLYYLTSNNQNMGGTMTEAEIEAWLEDVFDATGSGSSRLAACSALALSVFDQLAAGRLQTVPKEDTYGVAISQWVTAHGTLNLVKHRLLKNGATTGDGWGGYVVAVDPAKVKFRYLQNRNTKLLVDRQGPGVDGWIDEYLTECGWQVENPEVHGVATGITG